MISLIVPTCRIGGLDVLFDGLSRQTEKDFELVVADGVHRYRTEIPEHGFELQHVPVAVGFEKNEYCRTVNAGITAARGDVMLFLTDYTWLPEDYVEMHARWHREHPDPLDCLTTPHKYARCPELAASFPTYGMKDYGLYREDLEEGRLSKFSASIFRHGYTGHDVEADPRHVKDIDADGTEVLSGGPDPKESQPDGGISPNFVHLKGDSAKAELVSRMAGPDGVFPLELDGGHGYQDTWFGLRTERLGARWTLSRQAVQWIPQVRDRFPRMPRTKSFAEQEALMRGLVLRT